MLCDFVGVLEEGPGFAGRDHEQDFSWSCDEVDSDNDGWRVAHKIAWAYMGVWVRVMRNEWRTKSRGVGVGVWVRVMRNEWRTKSRGVGVGVWVRVMRNE